MTAQILSERAPTIRRAAIAFAVAGVLALLPASAHAGLLDFEHTPNGSTPADNAALTTP